MKLKQAGRTAVLALASAAMATAALAQNLITNKAEVEAMLAGASFVGVYLRTESAYVLNFGRDGTLTDSTGAKARWWVSDRGEYCREWLDGKLAGNKGCMGLESQDGQVALYADGRKVAEGVLTRK